MTSFPEDLPISVELTRAARLVYEHEQPFVLGYYPVARTNPYQSLLYSQGIAAGFASVALPRRADLAALAAPAAMGVRTVLHLHWTSEILKEAVSSGHAEDLAGAFLVEIRGLKALGIGLVWTVHNVFPHRCAYPLVEAGLRAELARIADAVHVMNPDTAREVAPHYDLPADRICVIPHPSYVGAYPRHYEKKLTRLELGFEASDLVAGMVGSIQPYKGVDEFVDAASRAGVPRLRVVVAGMPGLDPDSAELVDRLERVENVMAMPRKLSDVEIARLVTALDIMVLPYRASLNSGSALLGLTFGVPVLAPDIGHFRHLVADGLGVGYEPGSEDGLTNVLQKASRFVETFDRNRALAYAEAMSASRISPDFFSALRSMLVGETDWTASYS